MVKITKIDTELNRGGDGLRNPLPLLPLATVRRPCNIAEGDTWSRKPSSRAFALTLGSFISSLIILSASYAQAYTDTQIVDAIYQSEGGARAQYAYGIRSVKYSTIAEARRICANTVRNNRKRFAKQNKYTDYIEFLASRYCPVGCDNDRGTNKYWVKNVRYFLKKGEQK